MSERLYLGAEAELVLDEYLERSVVVKRRLAKPYRHPELDARLRRERTRLEAQILNEVRAAGVEAPAVIDVHLDQASLVLERIGGRRLRDAIHEQPAEAAPHCRAFGGLVGRLHAAGYVHGDLTTSNVHVDGERHVLLDFGLAQRGADIEEFGVDLHLAERTFESSHPDVAHLFEEFLTGYRAAYPDARAVERRMDEIKSRARYA